MVDVVCLHLPDGCRPQQAQYLTVAKVGMNTVSPDFHEPARQLENMFEIEFGFREKHAGLADIILQQQARRAYNFSACIVAHYDMAAMLIEFVFFNIVFAVSQIGAHLFDKDLMTQTLSFPNLKCRGCYRDSE